MMDEQQLIEKLRLIERLHAGAATDGEREAAANAKERIRERLRRRENRIRRWNTSFRWEIRGAGC